MVMGQRWTEVEEGWRGEDWKEKKEKRAGGVLEHFFRELQVAGGRGKMRSPAGKRARQEATVEGRRVR